MKKSNSSEFQYLLSENIASSEKLSLWLERNSGDDFDLEEARLLVKEYLTEIRSFQSKCDLKTDEQHLFELISKTLKGDDWLV